MKASFEFDYQIGNEVYHKISGDKGIVLNIVYLARTNTTKYIVCFGRFEQDQIECLPDELSDEKVIV